MLTVRQYQIARKLIETKSPIKIKDLSIECKVSVRSIQYDLENVRGFFQKNNVFLTSQSHKGIWIECDELKRVALLSDLSSINGDKLIPEQDVRIQKILYHLLSSNEYITAADLATKLDVSRNTIFNDLAEIENLLSDWHLQLERRARMGCKVVGKELQIRLLFEYIVQKNFTNYDRFNFVKKLMEELVSETSFIFVADYFNKYMIKAVSCLKLSVHNNKNLSLQDNHLISVCIRLTVMGIRLQNGYTIGSYHTITEHMKVSNTNKIIFEAVKEFLGMYSFPLLADEFHYINGNIFNDMKSIDLVTVTKNIIDYVSERENGQFKKDVSLYHNLLAHLSLKFNNENFYVEAVTPFTKEIKNKHNNLFLRIKEACSIYLDLDILVLNEAFVTFIALHFLVSIERVNSNFEKARALYVCSTGRGVARLIKNRVEKEIKNIEIVAYCSPTEVEDICSRTRIQLIVSVFPIQSEIPVAIVEGIPTRSNINYIKELVKDITSLKNYYEERLDETLNENVITPYEYNSEQMSQEIILKGYELAYEILEVYDDEITSEKKNAFVLHVLLMVHRTYFQKQYDNFVYSKNDIESIDMIQYLRNIVKKHEIQINDAELLALTQYFKQK